MTVCAQPEDWLQLSGRLSERPRLRATGLLRSQPFLWGLLARLLFLPLPSAWVGQQLFVPFLADGVLQPLVNPWRYHPPHFFPYGSVLYAILLLPRLLLHHLGGDFLLQQPAVAAVLLKLPLLLLDLLLLRALCILAPRRHAAVVQLYWLNPVMFFITYVHGQLDLAAMSLALWSLVALCRDRSEQSALWLAAAVLCKAHVLLLVPLILVTLWQRDFAAVAAKKMARWLAVFVAVLAIGFLPHLQAGVLSYVTAASPEAFFMFAAQLDLGDGQHLYLGVAAVLAVLGRLCISTRMSQAGLVFGAGTLLATLVLCTRAMPGWYAWFVPFVCLFYVHYTIAPRALWALACGLYLLYFGLLAPESSLLPWPVPPLWRSAAFTCMQTAFAGLALCIWRLAVVNEAPLRGRSRPFMLGIAGDSGTGKNILSQIIADLFGGRATCVLEGDDYHKWERGHSGWQDYTHLDPKANHLEQLARHTRELVAGRMIAHPAYDHGTGTFTEPREKRTGGLLIVQGLHAFYLRQMRRQLDLRIFCAPDENVQLAWKLQRDVGERGASQPKVLEALRRRRDDARLHITPQRALADWVIEMQPAEPLPREAVLQGKMPRLQICHTLFNDAPIHGLVAALRQQPALAVQLRNRPGDIDRICLQIDGAPTQQQISSIAAAVFPHLRSITRGRRPPTFRSGLDGVTQLIALSLLAGAAQHDA